MPAYSYIDIHKHGNASSSSNDTLTIVNVHENFAAITSESLCSMGIHPWFINDVKMQYDLLKEAALNKNVIAIGECGLDHVKGVSFELQMEAFEMQIHLVNELQKPLIIHCVKAYPETLLLLKKATVPVVFHGFNKRLSIAREVLQHGYYLSFGAALLNESFAAYHTLPDTPIDHVFFETDDSSVDIKEVYKAASNIYKTPMDAIVLQVQKNFKTVFNL